MAWHLNLGWEVIQGHWKWRLTIGLISIEAQLPSRGGGTRRNIATTFGTENLEWRGYHMKKLRIRSLVSIQYTNVTDRQTDRHVPHDGIGRAMHSVTGQKKTHTFRIIAHHTYSVKEASTRKLQMSTKWIEADPRFLVKPRTLEWKSLSRHIVQTIAPPTARVNQSCNERWMVENLSSSRDLLIFTKYKPVK